MCLHVVKYMFKNGLFDWSKEQAILGWPKIFWGVETALKRSHGLLGLSRSVALATDWFTVVNNWPLHSLLVTWWFWYIDFKRLMWCLVSLYNHSLVDTKLSYSLPMRPIGTRMRLSNISIQSHHLTYSVKSLEHYQLPMKRGSLWSMLTIVLGST